MVMAEMPQPRDAFMLIRGAIRQARATRSIVPARPAALPPLPKDAPANAPGPGPMAGRSVASAHGPRGGQSLLAAVFSAPGIVKTAEDFGAQGQWPTHPELLDWLATEFVGSGWNVKHMQKLIVMSATYRQSSRVTPATGRARPREPAAGPRPAVPPRRRSGPRQRPWRSSGLLRRTGRRAEREAVSARGLWEAVGFVGSNTAKFKQDQGDALYRRSLYTFWKRTCPPPSLLTFDAPSREACTVRRARTNTPLQALVLLNDKQYVEAARQAGRTDDDRRRQRRRRTGCAYAFPPGDRRGKPIADELACCCGSYQRQLAEFQADSPTRRRSCWRRRVEAQRVARRQVNWPPGRWSPI